MIAAIPQSETTERASGNGQPGAPANNRNAMRHGLRGAGLPNDCGKIETAINRFRRTLEDAVLAARQEIALVDAASINSAYRWERHAHLSQRWLTAEADSMSAGDRLNYSREIARASAERDKAIAALDLPKRPSADPWGTLHNGSNGNG